MTGKDKHLRVFDPRAMDEVKVAAELALLDAFVAHPLAQGNSKHAPPDEYDDDDDAPAPATQLRFIARTAVSDMASDLVVKAVQSPGMGMGMDNLGNYDDDNDEEPGPAAVVQQAQAEPQTGLNRSRNRRGAAKPVWGDHVGRDSESDDDADAAASGQDVVKQAASRYHDPVITVHDPFDKQNHQRPGNAVPVSQSQKRSAEPLSAKQQEANLLFGGAAPATRGKRKVRRKKLIKKGGGAATSQSVGSSPIKRKNKSARRVPKAKKPGQLLPPPRARGARLQRAVARDVHYHAGAGLLQGRVVQGAVQVPRGPYELRAQAVQVGTHTATTTGTATARRARKATGAATASRRCRTRGGAGAEAGGAGGEPAQLRREGSPKVRTRASVYPGFHL